MLPGALDVERLHPFLRGVTDDVFRPCPIFPRFPPLSPDPEDPEERLVSCPNRPDLLYLRSSLSIWETYMK